MKHHSVDQWVDYSRGAAPAEDQRQMKDHLESGCRKCQRLADMWDAVSKLAQKEANYQPPDRVVRFVKGHFMLTRPRGKPSLPARLANLVFDSFRQPLPAGVRSFETSVRHLVYRTGRVLVDVRLEPARETLPGAVVGQILDHSEPDRAVKDASVSVQSGENRLASTKTNRFGVFHLALSSAAEDLQLAIEMRDSSRIFVPLPVIEAVRKGSLR